MVIKRPIKLNMIGIFERKNILILKCTISLLYLMCNRTNGKSIIISLYLYPLTIFIIIDINDRYYRYIEVCAKSPVFFLT